MAYIALVLPLSINIFNQPIIDSELDSRFLPWSQTPSLPPNILYSSFVCIIVFSHNVFNNTYSLSCLFFVLSILFLPFYFNPNEKANVLRIRLSRYIPTTIPIRKVFVVMAAVVLKRVAPSETIGPLNKRLRKSGGARRVVQSLVDESVALLPQPRGSPPVWSDKRQGLCSALPYYKGYQSGGYISDRVLMGSLLDGFPAERDLVDPNGVIIMNM